MESCIVRTKEELKTATDAKVDRIIVRGELAEHLNTALKLKTASKWSIGILAVALATAPLTGGLSLIPIAALSGVEFVIIVAIVAIGILLFWAIFWGYEPTFSGGYNPQTGEVKGELILQRRSQKSI